MHSHLITIEGRVQNVGFRRFTAQLAFQFQITGYVRNLQNGNLEVEAHGDETMMEFINQLSKGPSASRVIKTIISDIPFQAFDYFEIRY